MTIDVRRPELEALILERMTSSGLDDPEDVLLLALTALPSAAGRAEQPRDKRTGADLIAALQASPYREIEIEPARCPLPARDVAL